MITTCTHCGRLYEAGSEEQANEATRSCHDCMAMTPSRASDLLKLDRYINGMCGMAGAVRPEIAAMTDQERAYLVRCNDARAKLRGDSTVAAVLNHIAERHIW